MSRSRLLAVSITSVALISALPAMSVQAKSPSKLTASVVYQRTNAALKDFWNAHGWGSSTDWISRKTPTGTVKFMTISKFSGDAGVTRANFAQMWFKYTSKTSALSSTVFMNYSVKGKRAAVNLKGRSKWVCHSTKTLTGSIVGYAPTSFFGSNTSPTAGKSLHPRLWLGKSISFAGKPVYVVHVAWHSNVNGLNETIDMVVLANKATFLVPHYSAGIWASGPGGSVHATIEVNVVHYGEPFSPSMHGC